MTTIRTEAGMGGRLGRSNMTHWDLGAVVKSQARIARRHNDRSSADQECLDAIAVVDGPLFTVVSDAALLADTLFALPTEWDDDEPDCERYTDLLDDMLWDDESDDDDQHPWYAPTTEFGDVLDFGNDEEFIANQGFIVTRNKWYC